MDRHKFSAFYICNVDATGEITIQKMPKPVMAWGAEQFRDENSAERGYLPTVWGYVTASVNSVPPMIIFHKRHFKATFNTSIGDREKEFAVEYIHNVGWQLINFIFLHTMTRQTSNRITRVACVR